MQQRGVTDLPLHGGKAPWWLLSRMKPLARNIVSLVIDEYGQNELVRRLANPYWFQALSCVLAFDWHSSGTTTVLCGVLKSVIDPVEHGVGVAGGKGAHSRQTPTELGSLSDSFGLSSSATDTVLHSSRMAAKVDSAAVQDNYDLYHHCVFLSEKGHWSVVQQGLKEESRFARRYQWADGIESLVIEPHTGITGSREADVLDMTAKQSVPTQKTITDLVKEDPTKVKRLVASLHPRGQSGLDQWMGSTEDRNVPFIELPERVNWGAIKRAYEWQPSSFEDVLEAKGMGAKTVRGLALVSQLVYGDEPSWEDPVPYSFAYGGKDGVPFPVERKAMDESVAFLSDAIRNSTVGNQEKLDAFRRLERYASRVKTKD
jgi:hypothetical protein